tara:strand:- start:18 stop:878 length:861 start_codon:yes stop_codon:yes gene_type:complete
MSGFNYKGTDLNDMVAPGTTSISSVFPGVNHTHCSNNSDKLGTTKYTDTQGDLGSRLSGKYEVFATWSDPTNTGQVDTHNRTVPSWANKMGVVVVGAGGGGSGGGGSAVAWYAGDAYQPGGNGARGGHGGQHADVYPCTSGQQVSISVGRAGHYGGGGGHASSPNQNANAGEGGHGGQGGATYVKLAGITRFQANGGNGGNRGIGGNVNDHESGGYGDAAAGNVGSNGTPSQSAANFDRARLNGALYSANTGKLWGNGGAGGNAHRGDGVRGNHGSSGKAYIVWKT